MNALTPISWPAPDFAPESEAERRARQLAALREITELGMQLARAAAARAVDPTPSDPEQPASSDPNLAFARAAGVVRQAIALETRIAAGTATAARAAHNPDPRRPTRRQALHKLADAEPERAAHNPDPRRPTLRQALHKLADAEPERAARAQLRRHIDERLDDELRADPDADLPLDLSQLPGEFLEIPSRPTAPEPPD